MDRHKLNFTITYQNSFKPLVITRNQLVFDDINRFLNQALKTVMCSHLTSYRAPYYVFSGSGYSQIFHYSITVDKPEIDKINYKIEATIILRCRESSIPIKDVVTEIKQSLKGYKFDSYYRNISQEEREQQKKKAKYQLSTIPTFRGPVPDDLNSSSDSDAFCSLNSNIDEAQEVAHIIASRCSSPSLEQMNRNNFFSIADEENENTSSSVNSFNK